ncbi:hypothetical protein FACS1894169_06260 [Bacteroidia bacterium]|nr:hypothetical protein FACS1894169_06260 [Bacteroidia bacterium]
MQFENDLATLVAKSLNSCFDIGLYLNFITKNGEVNLKDINTNIKKAINNEGSPYYNGRKLYFEIGHQKDYTESEFENLYGINEIKYSDFYKSPKTREVFSDIVDVSIIKDQRSNKFRYDIIDKPNCILFVEDILNKIYPEYEYSKQYSSKTHRFLKKISDNCFFGFEYNRRFYEQDLKTKLCLPDFRIIIINDKFQRNVSEKDYLLGNNESIIFIDQLLNPFFLSPVINISAIFGMKSSNGGNRYFIDELLNEKYDIYFRKYIFYQMYINNYYVVDYLNYLSKSIVDAINDNSSYTGFEYSSFELKKIEERTIFLKQYIPESYLKIENAIKQKLISQSVFETTRSTIDLMKMELDNNIIILERNNIRVSD